MIASSFSSVETVEGCFHLARFKCYYTIIYVSVFFSLYLISLRNETYSAPYFMHLSRLFADCFHSLLSITCLQLSSAPNIATINENQLNKSTYGTNSEQIVDIIREIGTRSFKSNNIFHYRKNNEFRTQRWTLCGWKSLKQKRRGANNLWPFIGSVCEYSTSVINLIDLL